MAGVGDRFGRPLSPSCRSSRFCAVASLDCSAVEAGHKRTSRKLSSAKPEPKTPSKSERRRQRRRRYGA